MFQFKSPQEANTLLSISDFAQPKGSNPSPAIPWEGIAGSPDFYFDTAVYKLPCVLKSPEQLKLEPFCIIALYQYFSKISTSQPFQFRSREAGSKEHVEIDDSDDDDHTLSPSNSGIVQMPGLPASISSPALPVPSMRHPTSPVTTVSPHSVTTATMVSGQPATTMDTTTPPQAETRPAALSLAPVEVTGGAGVIGSELGSASVDAPVNPPIPRKKGEASAKSKRKTSAKRANGDVVMGGTNPAPRRVSARTVDLKRKKMDGEAVDTQPTKRKKTTLKERWAYVTEEPNALYVYIALSAMSPSLPVLYYRLDSENIRLPI